MWNRISYRDKLLLWVMPVLLLGLVALAVGAYWYSHKVVEEKLTQSMLATAEKAAAGLELWCRTLVVEPETIAATPAAKAINESFAQIDAQNLNRKKFLQAHYPDLFLDIYAANREGVYHSLYLEGTEGRIYVGNVWSREYFQSIMAGGGTQLTPPLLSRTTGKPTIFAVAPILDENDKPQGLVGAGISLGYVEKMAQSMRVGETGYGIIVAKDGTFIYHPRHDFIMVKRISEFPDESIQELGRQMQSGGSGVYRYEFEGQKKVAFYAAVPFAGWSVATTIEEAELLAPLRQMLQFLLGITTLILVVVGLVLWLAARRLTQPLRQLDQQARRIGEGDLETPLLRLDSGDEVGRLAAAFRYMVEMLRQMVRELAQKNQDLEEARNRLEQKVAEKTQDLMASNEELTAMNEALEHANSRLEEEVEIRRQTGERLQLRERQYLAAMDLVTRPASESSQCLEIILRNALELVNAPSGYIGLYDVKAHEFVLHHAKGLHAPRIQKAFPMGIGMQGKVYASGELLYVEDYRTYPKRISDTYLASMTNIIMLPLKNGADVCGVFAASWEDEVRRIHEEDVETLRQFADLASVILERVQAQEVIRHMAFHDSLTGLPNRAGLQEKLREELVINNETKKGALFFVDMDDLKAINDNFGHSSGDHVIITAGNILCRVLGKDAFVSRLGGDEFIAVLSDLEREAASAVAEQVIRELSCEYAVAGRQVHLSASLGVALYPEDGETEEELLKRSDSAMYAAKRAGRNCWRFYETALSDEAYERMALTNSLRRALENKELFLQYQPQLDLTSGRVSGFEALLRWRSEEHGFVSPAKFIPIAEECGLILPIGAWVLEEAARFAKRLAARGFGEVHIAVNISPKQLLAADFVKQVQDILTREEVAMEQIVLEVTEGIMIESMEESIGKLWELRKMGLLLALDDFGTGYSSLTYLKHLPINLLKMDKSFINVEEMEGTQEEMIASIISLGHTLGMVLVAEGVETEVQQEVLKRRGCDCLQGYIFSRPVDAEEALKFLM
ncbi:EAL domain-containing protein [Anaeromusa sp.]|uniref:bifunctional diguanylate cyclase/phosphodiesterase n=1 Tax=Anaeromusa sp. TaxID=1872520 RepID=UPI00262DA6D3|nr:EAL domain-containing protein [Anaeromusa sp.]MDD3158697.1 EAL domain-containing protein [Anaeromusa sp.]